MKEKCKNCANPSKSCISYLMTLSTKEMLEWCLMWKDRFGWSNSTLAEKSHVPKGTIDRIMRIGKGKDDSKGANMATIRPLICAITECTMEELESCDISHQNTIALIERAEKAEEERNRLRAVLDSMTVEHKADMNYLKEQIKFKESQMQAKDKMLEERYEFMKRKDRIIRILAFWLALAVFVIIAALVIDRFNSDIGFLWIDRMSEIFNQNTNATSHAGAWKL